jgi:hypothetical protein
MVLNGLGEILIYWESRLLDFPPLHASRCLKSAKDLKLAIYLTFASFWS